MRAAVWRILQSAALALLLFGSVNAELDPSVRPLPGANETSLRWENIHAAPLWIDGPRPELREHPWYPLFRYHSYLHEIDLEPGKTATIQLPRYSALRILATRRDLLRLEDLVIETSNGTGLLLQEPLQRGTDDKTALLTASTHSERLVRISRPKNFVGRVHVALFISRMYVPETVDEHTELLTADMREVAIRRNHEATPTSWWDLPAEKPINFDVEGPTKLIMESRVRYPHGATEIQRRTQISVSLDDVDVKPIRIDSAPDSRYIIEVDGCADAVGRIETRALHIPEGTHRLTLNSSQSQYVRIKARSTKPYLFAHANRPQGKPSDTPWINPRSDWRTAATDNQKNGSALAVAQNLREIARGDVRQIRLATLSNQVLEGYAFWRDVLPNRFEKVSQLSRRTFGSASLTTYGEYRRQRVVHENLARAQSEDAGSAWFTNGSRSLDYILPERASDSRIRLLVDATRIRKPLELSIRYGENAIRKLKVLPEKNRYLDRLRPSASGQIRRLSPSASDKSPRRDVASLVLPIRSDVRSVTVESTNPRVPIALQFRASRPGDLWENEFLTTLDQIGNERAYDELKRALLHAVDPDATRITPPALIGNPASASLLNHFTPMLRLVRARTRNFAAEVENPTAQIRIEAALQNSTDYATAFANAQRLETEGALVPALEYYAKAAQHEPSSGPHTAALSRVRLLRQLGEHVLANRILRGMFKFADDQSLKTAAWDVMDLEAAGNSSSRLRLAAVRLQHDVDDAAILNLIERLFDDGHFAYALSAAMTLPRSLRPLPLVHEAAASTGWWTTLERINQKSGSEATRAFWRGMRERRFGSAAPAAREFDEAGEQARPWRVALREETRIRERLSAEDLSPALIEDWARARFDAPGARYYRPANDLARSALGSAWLYALERDLGGTWFRSDASQPLEVEVIGPARLRVSARLVHGQTPETGVDNWLMVASEHGEEHIAVLGDMPSTGLNVTGSSDQAGRLTQTVVSVGPGLHYLRFYPRDGESFYRLEEETSRIESGVLPPITDDTVSAILDRPHRNDLPLRNRVWLSRECEVYSGENRKLDWKDRWLPRRQHQTAEVRKTPSAATTISALSELIATKDTTRPVIESPAADAVHELLWALDNGNMTIEQALTETLTAPAARDSARRYRLASAIKRRASSAWKYISTVTASAGVHTVEVDRWSPENPSLRIRQSLMPSLRSDEALLTGGRELVIALDNLKPTELVADLALSEVLYQLESPLIVQWAVDESGWKEIELDHSNRSQRLEIPMKSGQHALRVRIKSGVANQYLRVRVRERRNGSLVAVSRELDKSWQVATSSEPVLLNVKGPTLLRVDQRVGELITSKIQRIDDGWQKLEFDAKDAREPVLYRFHRLVPGAGTPPARLASVSKTPTPVELARPAIVRPRTAPVLELEDRFKLGQQEDGTWSHWLGYRYDQASPTEDLEDTPSPDQPSDRYFEYSLTKRRYTDSSPLWFAKRWTRFGGVLRVRPDGSPTVGATGRVDWRFKDKPLAVFVAGEAFAQKLDERRDQVTPISVQLSAGVSQTRKIDDKTWHVPSASVTLRSTTPNDFRKGPTELVDRDVYTTYRRTHKCAVRVGDTFYHQPWLDTVWYAGVSATTNPCFNPFDLDRISGRIGWRQMYGPFEFDGQYYLRHGFNDDDRDGSVTSHGFRIEGNWNDWVWNQQRVQAKGWWDHDFSDGSDSIYLGVGLHFSQGRQYRDFRPSEVRFRSLREARMPNEPNNIIRGVFDD